MAKGTGRKLFLLSEAEQWFYDHSGFSFDPRTELLRHGRVRTAVLLAYAEKCLRASDCYVDWQPDEVEWDGDVPYDGPLSVAILVRDDGRVLATLGSCCTDGTGDHAREVEAELALEHLTQEHEPLVADSEKGHAQ